jgi:hypothetical protein
MKRTSHKINETIKSGKKPRRKQARVIAMSSIDMTQDEALELGRAHIERLGFQTDGYGMLAGGLRGLVDRLRQG